MTEWEEEGGRGNERLHGKAKTIVRRIWLATAAVFLWGLFGWKIPVFLKIETLNLPPGCETVYRTKVQLSDVYWFHIKGEKVVKCSLGLQEVREYIERNNSESKMEGISVYPYGGMSDTAVYDSEFDKEFWKQPDREDYFTISYFKKLP